MIIRDQEDGLGLCVSTKAYSLKMDKTKIGSRSSGV